MALILMLFKVLLLATAAILEMHRNKNHSAATKARIKAACSFLVDFLFFFLKKKNNPKPTQNVVAHPPTRPVARCHMAGG